MENLIFKAQTLVEALPYIKDFYGKSIVVKYGGSVAEQDLTNFARDLILMKYVGIKPVVVHGGGPQIGAKLDQLGIKTSFIAGLRVTDRDTMEVAEMVLVGKINQEIITAINMQGGKAVGLSGKEGKIIEAVKVNIENLSRKNSVAIPKDTDFGHVGEVASVNPTLIKILEDSGYIPVIAPIGSDSEGNSYNINADHVAGKIAGALKASKLILLTNVPGIYDENSELISSVDEESAKILINKGVISKGMIPKVMCAIEALEEGVEKVHIIDGRIERALILEIFTDAGIGTEITI